MGSTSRRTRCTDYRCSLGHEFYSWSPTWVVSCPFGRCNGTVEAVKGYLFKKKDGGRQ